MARHGKLFDWHRAHPHITADENDALRTVMLVSRVWWRRRTRDRHGSHPLVMWPAWFGWHRSNAA